MSQSASSNRSFALRAVAVVLLGLALMRLNAWVGVIASGSVQMDFAAFYGAGQSLNLGYNPYENNMEKRPPVWDGLSAYRHSRFLYPPLAATLFRPLAMLSYPVAKMVWIGIGLASLLGTILLSFRITGLKSVDALLLSCAGAASFFPLLCNLDRGQIDLVTLLFITVSVYGLSTGRRAGGVGAGAVLAFVVLLKLHAVLFVPFLILRRRWDALAGLVIGGVLLGGLSLAFNGRAAIEDYLRVQLPRIAEYGENGTPEMLMPLDMLNSRIDPSGKITMDGKPFAMEAVKFFPNATLVRPLRAEAKDAGFSPKFSALSLGLFAVGFVGVALTIGLRSPGPRPPGREELLYWLTAMALVMVTAPLTWTMNVVWLIPALPLAFALGASAPDRATAVAVALLVLAFVIAWLPDTRAYAFLRPLAILDEGKYIAAEILTVIAGAFLVRRSIAARRGAAPAPTTA